MSDLTWDQYYGNTYYGYAISHPADDEKKAKTSTEETTTEVPTVIQEAAYEKYVEEHIIPEPEQVITTATDYIEAASVAPEHFESVLGELPDAEPSLHPEEDAELTPVEKEVVKENITETTVKAVTVKAKKHAGRPKKK